jgi:hypothetical protein
MVAWPLKVSTLIRQQLWYVSARAADADRRAIAALMRSEQRSGKHGTSGRLSGAQAEAWAKFDKLKTANEGAWTDFKAHMDKAGAEVKAAVESMTTNLKK